MNTLKLRIAEEMMSKMRTLAEARYPEQEWATYLECGWHSSGDRLSALTVVGLVEPRVGDLNVEVEHVELQETYTLRTAMTVEKSGLAPGVVHSHPKGFRVTPSPIDDDMDRYHAQYFAGFAPGRPYVSLILGRTCEGVPLISGRAHFQDRWYEIDEVVIVGSEVLRNPVEGRKLPAPPPSIAARMERFLSGFGAQSAARLWGSTVMVVGCGGTGSAALHSLARSNVGRIILVDTDRLENSNAERIHGAFENFLPAPGKAGPPKVEVARKLIHAINSKIEVIAFEGNLLHDEIRTLAIESDLVLGCTDSHHGRVAASELAFRYFVPVLQVNVTMETKQDRVTGQVLQLNRYGPGLGCAYCRSQVNAVLLSQELMTPEERDNRKNAAEQAVLRGEKPDPYWTREPIIPTVGSLTTLAAELMMNSTLGILTGRYSGLAQFLELDLLAVDLGVISVPFRSKPDCSCTSFAGHGDASEAGRLISAPGHWSTPKKR